jgi:hypothetical protein
MTNQELEARLDDIDAQLKKLFSFHGPASWESFKRQEAENAKASVKAPFHQDQRFGRPKQ